MNVSQTQITISQNYFNQNQLYKFNYDGRRTKHA